MPEQIALAEKRGLPGVRFLVGDASDVGLPDACADIVIIFGILHHVERWREAVGESCRLLRSGGMLIVEEPDAIVLRGWDRIFRWGHPHAAFSLAGLEQELRSNGLTLARRWKLPGVFGIYRADKAAPGAG